MRRVGRVALMVVAWVLALVLALFTFVIVSRAIPWPLILVNSLLNSQGLYLIPAGLLTAGLAAYLYRDGARRTGAVAGAIAVITTIAACVPVVAVWRAADRYGASLSLGAYLDGGDNTGKPVEPASVVYNEVDGQQLKLDVKLPAGEAAAPRAAVVWVHGGGWNVGDRGEAPLWHKWLNERGYAVFAIDYRLAPPPRWDQAPGDVKCAVGWVKAHAGEYKVDPARVMLAGGSAGGNLSLMGAYSDDRVKPSCAVTDTSVRAVAVFYPPVDNAQVWEESGFPQVRTWAQNYNGGKPDQVPDRYRAGSPITYVRPGLPPTLLMHGKRDHIVPYDQSPELDAALTRAGVPHKLVSIPYAEHIFDFAWGAWGTQICRHVLGEFLREHFPA
ncbi:alpha/beta hydrolase [Longispora albida]|uniref:alpha/beta hydrolase n=1 Tax=Longispora albida TaxID=203523 RepID=UPI001B7F8F9E|nr:alpha/beta hydrolase [Longispora albida]